MSDPTPTEKEAILLRWRHLHPEAAADSAPTKEESDQLLSDIRARASTVESEAMKILNQKMRVVSATGAHSKQSAISLVIAIVAVILAFLLYALIVRR